ncbi:CHAD domain-containing protein [Amycolatopsis eburnea]|uniref:CHAD domain-containing protein n=1 Tax=Amycolatopsis eburnea TaxID=2267691 RepID=A0A427T1K1_9PSEU|nr:CHAD domain-containing protein [Amycolatopsis eburnea]RSD11646.1 CHAD domain-containing protein [Amycolatopsis eburnea]
MSATVTSLHETEFFDTESLRLLRHGLTLGIQAGRWWLDTPDGPISLAGSDRGVPPTLSRLVRAYTRDDRLVPVARLRGGREDLRARLGGRIAVPPRPHDGSARGVVLEYVRTQIAALAAADLAVRRGMPDSVHRLRVAARRLRGAFTAYAPALGGRKLLKEFGGALRWLGGELAPARDTEVQWARSRTWAHERTDAYFAQLTEDANARVRRALDSYRYLQLLNALDVLEVVLSEQPRDEWAPAARRPAAKVLPRLARAVAEDVDGRVAALATAPDRARAVHDIRKATKRLRYALEAGAAVIPVDPKALRAFQDLLGEFQDAVVARGHLRVLQARHGGFEAVLAAEADTADRCVEELPAAWRRLDLGPLWTWPGEGT